MYGNRSVIDQLHNRVMDREYTTQQTKHHHSPIDHLGLKVCLLEITVIAVDGETELQGHPCKCTSEVEQGGELRDYEGEGGYQESAYDSEAVLLFHGYLQFLEIV